MASPATPPSTDGPAHRRSGAGRPARPPRADLVPPAPRRRRGRWRQSFVDSAWVDPPSVCCGAFSDPTRCSRLCDVPKAATTGLTEDRLGVGVGGRTVSHEQQSPIFFAQVPVIGFDGRACSHGTSYSKPAQTAVDQATAAKTFGGEMGTSGSAPRHGFWLHSPAGGAVAIALALAPQLASADEVGESFWTPGSFGSLAATASQPGFSLTSTYYHTSTTAGSEVARARLIRIGRVTGAVDENVSAIS